MNKALFLFFLPLCVCAQDFSSLSLAEAETIALEKNKEILLSQQLVSQKSFQKFQAISSWLPSVNFTSMYARLQKPQEIFPLNQETKYVINQVVVNQPLFSTDLIFGLRSSKLLWKTTQMEERAASALVIFQVREAYYATVLSHLSIQMQEEVIRYLSEALRDEEKKYQVGKSTLFQVNQLKVALNTASSTLHTFTKELKKSQSMLTFALGVDPTVETTVDVSAKEISLSSYPFLEEKLKAIKDGKQGALFSEQEIASWISTAQLECPDLKRSSLLLQAAQEELKTQRGRYLPTVSAFFDYGYYKPFNGMFFKQQYNMSGGILLNWNVFDSFKREFKIKEAAHVRNAAHLNFEKQTHKAYLQVRSSLSQIEEALFSFAAAEESLSLAKQALDEAQVRLSAGGLTPLEYREAMRSYAEANLQSSQLKFDLLLSYFQLLRDTGK